MSYLENKGKYQKQYDLIIKSEIIPTSGKCDVPYLEQLRIVDNIYYGLHNNGNFSIGNGDYHKDFNNIKYHLPEEVRLLYFGILDLNHFNNHRGEFDDDEKLAMV